MNGAVEVIEEVAPAAENGRFILVLVQLVVDILKLNRFGIIVIRYPADAVREHPLKRNGILCGFVSFVLSSSIFDRSFNLLSFRSCELVCLGQCAVPPYLICPAAPAVHKSSEFHTVVLWSAGSRPARCCG